MTNSGPVQLPAAPIDSRAATRWAQTRTWPAESRIEPEHRVLRRALRICEHLPRRGRGYAKAVALRLFAPREVRLGTAFGTIVTSRHDHMFIRPVFDEPFETAIIWRLVEPGTTFVDVGANRGWYTLLGAHLAGPSGRVLAFEPDVRPRAVLERNLEVNPDLASRVRVLPVAVADGEGSGRFVATAESALSHLERLGDDAGSGTTVEVRTLCSVLAEVGGPPVGVVKIDVEGAEDLVLAGLEPCLAALDVPVILVEAERLHLAKFGATITDLARRLTPTHEVHWVCWRHARLEPIDGPYCGDAGRNILALRRRDADELRRRVVV